MAVRRLSKSSTQESRLILSVGASRREAILCIQWRAIAGEATEYFVISFLRLDNWISHNIIMILRMRMWPCAIIMLGIAKFCPHIFHIKIDY